MSHDEHSWVEVRRLDFVRALRKLAKFPRARKSTPKFILRLDGEELELTSGVHSVRVPASGQWCIAAVFAHPILEAMTLLADGAVTDKPLRITGVDEHVRVGSASLPCSFQNPEINQRGAAADERIVQRAGTDKAPIGDSGPTGGLEETLLLGKIKELYPTSALIPPYRVRLVVIPELPNLLLRLSRSFVEFRIVSETGAEQATWFKNSSVWKKMTYPAVREFGLGTLLQYAAHVADSPDGQEPPECPV